MASATFEAQHVHQVYDHIAKDFSRTRHTRWPFVQHFMDKLESGSIVLDAGCGNGKYLGCGSVLPCDQAATGAWPQQPSAPSHSGEPVTDKGKGKESSTSETSVNLSSEQASSRILPLGFDMSAGLLGIAAGKGHEVVRGDCFDMSCWRSGAFDHAISIATIHHFATPERRMESIKQIILAVLPPVPAPTSSSSTSPAPARTAQILIVVWALEQDPSLAGLGSARRKTTAKKGATAVPSSALAGVSGSDSRPITGDAEEQDVFVPWELQAPRIPKPKKPSAMTKAERAAAKLAAEEQAAAEAAAAATAAAPVEPKPTFQRYYHLFRQYELSSLFLAAAQSLGATFDAPKDYPLASEVDTVADELARTRISAAAGEWQVQVEIKEERWERENWVVEAAVRWVAR